MKKSKSKRIDSLEFLKIIAIMMVIGLHYFNKDMGGILSEEKNIYGFLTHFLESFFIIACNIFILITGFFSINKKSISYNKIKKILFDIIFYAIVIFICYLIIGQHSISFHILKTFFDSIFKRWFPIVYIIVYLLIPYLNKLLNNISKKDYQRLLIIYIAFFSIWSVFINNITIIDNGYGITNFIFMYMVGGYIYKNQGDFKKTWLNYVVFFISLIFVFALSLFSHARAWGYCSIFVVLESVSFFLIFLNINMNNNLLSKIAKHSLAVYIIHENQFISKFIYNSLFKSNNYYNNNLGMIINLLISVFLILFICTIIDCLKEKILLFIMSKYKKKDNEKIFSLSN